MRGGVHPRRSPPRAGLRRSRRAPWLGSLLLLTTACGSDDTTGTGGGASSTAQGSGGDGDGDGGDAQATTTSSSSAQTTVSSTSSGEVTCTDASSCDDANPCTEDGCGADARCTHVAIAIDDGDFCTIDGCDPLVGPTHEPFLADDGDLCTLDVCDPSVGTSFIAQAIYFSEDFADDQGGWTFTAPWEIGPASASPTNAFGMADPADDATPTDDGGIAGVVIGGTPPAALDGIFHLESPPFDAQGDGFVVLEFQRWLGEFPHNDPRVQVWEGNSWVEVWDTPRDVADAPPRGDGWQLIQRDVTEWRNAGMRVRFSVTLGALAPAPSWNVDDVVVYQRGWAVDDNACTIDSCGGGGPIATDVDIDDEDACTIDTCHFRAGVAHTPVSCDDVGDGCCPSGCPDDPDC